MEELKQGKMMIIKTNEGSPLETIIERGLNQGEAHTALAFYMRQYPESGWHAKHDPRPAPPPNKEVSSC